jgi:hypothetical protein
MKLFCNILLILIFLISCSNHKKDSNIEAVYSYDKKDSIVKVVYENKSDSNYFFIKDNSILFYENYNPNKKKEYNKFKSNDKNGDLIQIKPVEKNILWTSLIDIVPTKEEIELDSMLTRLVRKIYPNWSVNSPVTCSSLTIPKKSKRILLYKLKRDNEYFNP